MTESEEMDTARRSVRLRAFVKYLQEAFTCLEMSHVPVIAVVCGRCIGAGVDLITACDLRVGSLDTARFSVKEVDVGLAADLGTLQRLQKVVGNDSWVREVCYTAREFPASEAMKMGLLSYAEPNDVATKERALNIAKEIASKSPVAISGTKFALNFSRNTSDGLAMQAIWNSAMLQTNDIMTAIALDASQVGRGGGGAGEETFRQSLREQRRRKGEQHAEGEQHELQKLCLSLVLRYFLMPK
eukprot:GHVS01059920.1.p1 GENE.GHVS01059920.1~~GHVS01059920.1.p1  ORF type:complete len:243 (+),score=43.51 GHVS01059920.1:452-1180(+)